MAISRRALISAAAAGAGMVLLPETSDAQAVRRKRVLRIAHLTDIHVQPEGNSARWMERALGHAQSQAPDLIVVGGDQIMDALACDKDRMRAQWDLYRRVWKANLSAPLVHCMGNHDVWGWNQPTNYGHIAGYGKRYALDAMEMDDSYHSFDRGGWHFVVLDSTFPKTVGYTAKLDEPQYEWLEDDLKRNATKKTMVISHIPIISATPFFDGPNEKSGNWRVPGAWMHIDARRLKDLFARNRQVKACISGHIHLVDRVHYAGVTYMCNGAVSGAWWKGAYQEFMPGYSIIDLYDDGLALNRYMGYGWTA